MSSTNHQNVTSDAASEYTLVDKDNASIYSKTETITDNDKKQKKSMFDRLKPSSRKSYSSSSQQTKKDIPKRDPLTNWEARVCASTFR